MFSVFYFQAREKDSVVVYSSISYFQGKKRDINVDFIFLVKVRSSMIVKPVNMRRLISSKYSS